MLNKDITDKILKAFYSVSYELGYGFLEKVYENALVIELKSLGLRVNQQSRIYVFYKNHKVGEYFADLVVEDKVIVELKAADLICKEHEYQLINYLRATKIEVGLLLNFGKKPQFKRKVFSNISK